jgi:transcriptional regulator with XRE-family HTH domain
MNIEIANRLVELRKKNGLSQEELAEKLGLSRQAVSKWERAEASPDTDNLICLAKIYNVSLDELLKTDAKVEDIVNEQVKIEDEKDNYQDDNKGYFHVGEDGVKIKKGKKEINITEKGLFINNKRKNFSISDEGIEFCKSNRFMKYRRAKEIVVSIFALISLAGFITLGLRFSAWHPAWLIFLLIPIAESVVTCIRKRRITSFAYSALVLGVYLGLGFSPLRTWHPYWFLFLTIPIFYIVFTPIEKAIWKSETNLFDGKDFKFKGPVVYTEDADVEEKDDKEVVSE